MTTVARTHWTEMRSADSARVEAALRPHFRQVDAYRYNPASIRVRVIDPVFEDKSYDDRDDIVDRHLQALPVEIRRDIMSLLTLAPSELEDSPRTRSLNAEFEEPTPSIL